MSQKPSVGRIVHYHSHFEMQPVAAIVTRVYSDTQVDLTLLRPGSMPEPLLQVATYREAAEIGFWSWPERV